MNKEKLQEYNEILSENNLSLEDINNTINELPDVSNLMEKFEINDTSYLFYRGVRVELLDILAPMFKNVTNTGSMFAYWDVKTFDANVLDVSTWETMRGMFSSMQQATLIDTSKFNTSNVTDINALYSNNSKLTNLDLRNFDISKVKDIGSLVGYCISLETLNLEGWNASNVKYANGTFNNLPKLVNLTFMNNFGKGFSNKQSNYVTYKIDLSKSTLLTYESLMDVINKLYDLNLTYDVANGGTLYTQQLIIGSDNIAKLSNEELSIATAKGWVVS